MNRQWRDITSQTQIDFIQYSKRNEDIWETILSAAFFPRPPLPPLPPKKGTKCQ